MSESLENSLEECFQNYGHEVDSSMVSVYHKGKCKFRKQWGCKTYKFYDLASLTKVFFTTTAFMYLYEKQSLNLEQPVRDYVSFVPDWVRIKDLLSHRSGALSWLPWSEKKISCAFSDFVCEQVKKLKWDNSKSPLYSDVGFIILGVVLEKIFGRSLSEILKYLKNEKDLPLGHMQFCLEDQGVYLKSCVAPTFALKRGCLASQGLVNDANCRHLGGASTHAGLFGRLEDIELWGQHLRSSCLQKVEYEKKFFSHQTLNQFCQWNVSDYGYGFMKGGKEAGKVSMLQAGDVVGHTAYTGPSFWWDRQIDLLICFVCNRKVEDFYFRSDLHQKIRKEFYA